MAKWWSESDTKVGSTHGGTTDVEDDTPAFVAVSPRARASSSHGTEIHTEKADDISAASGTAPKYKSRTVYPGYMNGHLDTPLMNEFVDADSDSDATDWSNAEVIGSHVA